jgi:hypothetical protein
VGNIHDHNSNIYTLSFIHTNENTHTYFLNYIYSHMNTLYSLTHSHTRTRRERQLAQLHTQPGGHPMGNVTDGILQLEAPEGAVDTLHLADGLCVCVCVCV